MALFAPFWLVFDTFNFKKMLRPWNPGPGSLKVIETGSIPLPEYGGYLLEFSIVILSINAPFWDIWLSKRIVTLKPKIGGY